MAFEQLSKLQRNIKSVADLLPVFGFFGVFFFFGRDIMVATSGLVAGLCTQIVIYLILRIRIPTWMKVVTSIGLFFAVVTLIFDDPVFVKVRSSVTGSLIGLILIGSVLIKRNVLELILREFVHFPKPTWNAITILWSLPIFANAALNLVIANQMPGINMEFSHDTWMTYRLVSGFGVVLLSFGLIALYLILTRQKPMLSMPQNEQSADSSPRENEVS